MKMHFKFELWMCLLIANIHIALDSGQELLWLIFAFIILIFESMSICYYSKYSKDFQKKLEVEPYEIS
jgi:hypothetical protein